MNRHFQSFRSEPTPGVVRYLQAPETFEGVVQRVDVTYRRLRASPLYVYIVGFILDPLDVFGATAPEMLVHDEVVYDTPTDVSPETFAAFRARDRAQREHERERRQAVRVPYVFPTHDAAMWKMRTAQIASIYRNAFGDDFADELTARLLGTPLGELNVVGPFFEDKDADGGYVAPAMRQLQELRGLRFVVNAVEMVIKSKNAKWTHYEWTRS